MNSREKILGRLNSLSRKTVKPINVPHLPNRYSNLVEKFTESLTSIGGVVRQIDSIEQINDYLSSTFVQGTDSFIYFPETNQISQAKRTAHEFATTKVVVLKGLFGVAENGAVWVTEKNMLDRAVPFICENLFLVIERDNIVPTMHEAYERLKDSTHELGVFIAGPSKTADIEQSLVLGAHGPKTMGVFLI